MIKLVRVFAVQRVVNEIARLTAHETFPVGWKEFLKWTLEGLWYNAEGKRIIDWIFGRHDAE